MVPPPSLANIYSDDEEIKLQLFSRLRFFFW